MISVSLLTRGPDRSAGSPGAQCLSGRTPRGHTTKGRPGMKSTCTNYEVDVTSWPPEGVSELHRTVTALARKYDTAPPATPVAATNTAPGAVEESEDESNAAVITKESYDFLLGVIENNGGHAQAAVLRQAMATGKPVLREEALALLGKAPTDKLPKFRSKVIAGVKELQSAGLLDESIDPKYDVMSVDYGKGVQALSFYLGEALRALRARLVAEGKL
jgi:hypothetical protein